MSSRKLMPSNVSSIDRSSARGRSDVPASTIEEKIRLRAYQFYEQRGRESGRAEEDWLRAEQEVKGLATRKGTAA